jgi:hypothetical protein
VFIINGSQGMVGVISHGRATAKEAVEFAWEILGTGYHSVRIVSPDGRVWESPQFAKLLVAYKGRSDTDRS